METQEMALTEEQAREIQKKVSSQIAMRMREGEKLAKKMGKFLMGHDIRSVAFAVRRIEKSIVDLNPETMAQVDAVLAAIKEHRETGKKIIITDSPKAAPVEAPK